ncbi:MAG: hypothetical protein IPN92_18760 [Chromatiaceae bacterium]|nr:hypothetical protein [Chromatiaceae bacterium]
MKKIGTKIRHFIICKDIRARTFVRLIAAGMAIGGLEANSRDQDFVPESKEALVSTLAIRKASFFDTIIRSKVLSCPVSIRVDFTRDLEKVLKIRSSNIGQQISYSFITDKWDRIASEVFNCASYDEFIELQLNDSFIFGQTLHKINYAMIQILYRVEEDLINNEGAGYRAPIVNSTLRKKSGMHGWGLAIDFDVGINPYILNEKAEKDLDLELIGALDNIARFMLGKNESDLRKLKSGRSAFGDGSIGDVHDILQQESDAMKRYFLLMKNDAALQKFIDTEWVINNPDKPLPEFATIKVQMENDYRILGGKSNRGIAWRTAAGQDRPFAPDSMGGKGDPATGFLNLGKEFVEAMTARGFAWGAIDISGEPGDMQHFDLRLQGVGARVYNLLLKYK